MVTGFGRKGHAVGDIPGIRFKVLSVKGISLKKLYLGKASIRHWELYYDFSFYILCNCKKWKIKKLTI